MGSIRGSNTFVWDTQKLLGQGATSAVYMGRNKKTGDEVAVKVFNPQSYHRPTSVQVREFEVMTKLNHDNVVKLLAVEEEIPTRAKVIVMEYCTHGSLYNLLDLPENHFGLSEEEFLLVLSQVTAGVKHLRDHDIIHRDIKPGNILRSVAPDGRSVFKLTDFGAARELQQDEEFLSLYGTDEYLHPDMYERAVLRRSKGQQFGVYVDLWSLGVTFYHACTGSLPFKPYGGRRNKETMHFLTARKEHGVISGVQEQQDGPIKWRRDLPNTCKLSKGLKGLITPFLADLLEKDPARTISFDDFFTRVDDIIQRRPYHMFCPSSFTELIIYARPRDDMSQLRQLITDQTEIPGGAQLLLYNGRALKDESRDPVTSYLKHVTADNPIFVFNKLPEYKRFLKPEYGTFLEIPVETNVSSDYPLSKRNFAVLLSVKHAVKVLVTRSALMNKAVKAYRGKLMMQSLLQWSPPKNLVVRRQKKQVLRRTEKLRNPFDHSMHVRSKCAQLELSMGHVTRQCMDSKAWKDHLFSSLGLQATMLKMLTNNCKKPGEKVDVSSRVNMLQTLYQTGNRECSQFSTALQTKLEKATSLLQDMKTGQVIDIDWDPSIGCMPSDRCIEKMEFLVQKLHKIMTSFREDRNRSQLTNNDEQIHRFDKNKMKELCIIAQTQVDDDCTRKAALLFNAFKQYYGKAVQIHDAGERLECLVSEIVHQQGRLVDKLKVSGKQCVTQCETCLQGLEPASAAQNGVVSNHGDSPDSTVVNGGSMGSRQEKLESVIDSLQNTRSSLEEVRALLTENTSLIERFSSLGEPTEEDKSWEYVP